MLICQKSEGDPIVEASMSAQLNGDDSEEEDDDWVERLAIEMYYYILEQDDRVSEGVSSVTLDRNSYYSFCDGCF